MGKPRGDTNDCLAKYVSSILGHGVVDYVRSDSKYFCIRFIGLLEM